MSAQADASFAVSAVLSCEPECEYGHWGIAPCTGSVTHRITGCAETGANVCATAAKVFVERLRRDDCVDCGRRAADCWSMWKV